MLNKDKSIQPQQLSTDLTICTVSYNSSRFIELAWSLAARLNPDIKLHWLVIENSPITSEERLRDNDGRFTVIQGDPYIHDSPALGSYHHALGLNKALQMVTTRYALFIDPDFFAIRPFWVRDMLDHAQLCECSFFGAPYYPDRRQKYRYFPCVTFLLVDLGRISKSELDFSPVIDDVRAGTEMGWIKLLSWLTGNHRFEYLNSDLSKAAARNALRIKIANLFMRKLCAPLFVGSSLDTGYRVYRKYAHDTRHKRDCLVPAWNNPLYTCASRVSISTLKASICRILPDTLSIYPKSRNFTSKVGFRELGLPDLCKLGWEEYLWQDKPFGFHIRAISQGRKTVDYELLMDIVERIAPNPQTGD